jgi:hypothetical protein
MNILSRNPKQESWRPRRKLYFSTSYGVFRLMKNAVSRQEIEMQMLNSMSVAKEIQNLVIAPRKKAKPL